MISEKIVVVDDDKRIIQSIKMVLTDHEVVGFTDGNEAIRLLKQPNDINLAILDVMMPEINGIEVLKEIKSINRNISVIIMTAFSKKSVIIEALRHHADEFLEKPFIVEELIQKVEGLLRANCYSNPSAKNTDQNVEKIKMYIRKNYRDVTFQMIADKMSKSPKYLSRVFKEKTGKTFREYLLKTRMDIAKNKLKETSFKVDEISRKLGYGNAESFMRAFKQATGKTPTEYRKLAAKEN